MKLSTAEYRQQRKSGGKTSWNAWKASGKIAEPCDETILAEKKNNDERLPEMCGRHL